MWQTKRLDSFLCCFQLETGGLILGWFGIVGSFLSILICSLIIVGIIQGVVTDDTLQQMGFGDPNVVDHDTMDTIRNGSRMSQSFPAKLLHFQFFLESAFLEYFTRSFTWCFVFFLSVEREMWGSNEFWKLLDSLITDFYSETKIKWNLQFFSLHSTRLCQFLD